MRRTWNRAVVGGVGIAFLAVACGDDRMERGLSPAVENAVPVSPEELDMTEKERREHEERQIEEAEQKRFDADEN